jgi:hypothetical protein
VKHRDSSRTTSLAHKTLMADLRAATVQQLPDGCPDRWRRCNNTGLQFVAQRIVVTSLQAAFLSLPFPGDNQVFEAAGALSGRLAAFRAAFVALSPHLVFSLPRNRQMRELVDNKVVHDKTPRVRNGTDTQSCRDNKRGSRPGNRA